MLRSQQILQAWTERDSSLDSQLSTDKKQVVRENYSLIDMNHVLWESTDDSEAKANSPECRAESWTSLQDAGQYALPLLSRRGQHVG